MADSIESLKELALLIRNATKTGENTAERVGRVLVGIIDNLNNGGGTGFVTTDDTEQEITGLKHFINGLSVGANKHRLYEENGVVYLDGDLAVTGGITQYALGDTPVSTIMDGVVTDGVTITKQDGKLVVIGGTGSDFNVTAMWAALSADTTEQINKSHLTNALQGYATTDSVSTLQTEITKKWTQDDAKIKNWDTAFGWGNHAEAGYAHLALEETFTGLKHFTAGLSVGAGKHKLYEKDGVVYFDGDLAVTGGITQYALGDTPVSTIMDGVAVDGTTISKEGGVLKVIGGGGSSFDDAQMWKLLGASSAEQINKSHLTTALQGYATESWANSNFLGKTDKAVDSDKVDGIHANGFCRAYSASYSFGDNQNLITTAQFVEKLKSLGAFNQPYWMCKGSWYYAGNQIISDSGYGNIQLAGAVVEVMGHEGAYTIRITTAPATTNGARNSIFIYQNHGESYEPRWIKVASTFDNVYSADKLSVYDSNNVNNPNWDEYKATIQNFGASATGIPPVGDNANSVLNIPMSKHGTNKMYGFQMAFCSQNEEIFARTWKSGNIGSWYGIPMVVSDRLKKGFSSVECTDWFRSHGNTGWYSETWGGGIYMNDFTWVRTYNGKNFKSDNVVEAGTWLSAGIAVNVFGPVGNSWNNGQGAFQVGIPNDGNQTPILVAYNGPANSSSGTNRYFAIEVLNTGTRDVHFCVTGAETVRMRSNWFEVNGNLYATDNVTGRLIYRDVATTRDSAVNFFLDNRPAIKCEQDLAVIDNYTVRPILRWGDAVSNVGYNTRYVIGSARQGYDWGRIFMAVSNNDNGTSEGCSFSVYGSGYAAVNGNFLATGGITQYSDKRAKTIIEQITLPLKDIANSPAIRFKWNGWKQKDDGKTHIGGIAQYVQNILPEAIYNSDDVLTMDYATTGYIFAVQTAKHLLSYETKTDKEINKLKKRVKYLEKQLKKLGYEEANIVDN